jgi:hypothetical protein
MKGMTRDGEEGSRYRYGLALLAIYPDHLPETIDNNTRHKQSEGY